MRHERTVPQRGKQRVFEPYLRAAWPPRATGGSRTLSIAMKRHYCSIPTTLMHYTCSVLSRFKADGLIAQSI